VRDAVHALVTLPPAGAPPLYNSPPPAARSPPACGAPRGLYGADGPYDDEAEDWPPNWRDDEPRPWREVAVEDVSPPPAAPAEAPRRYRWHRALAVGCTAAGWWLRRQAGRWAALVALGLGLLAAGAAFTVGSGLAEAALGLLTLADTAPLVVDTP
jgi:hypothetical protein